MRTHVMYIQRLCLCIIVSACYELAVSRSKCGWKTRGRTRLRVFIGILRVSSWNGAKLGLPNEADMKWSEIFAVKGDQNEFFVWARRLEEMRGSNGSSVIPALLERVRSINGKVTATTNRSFTRPTQWLDTFVKVMDSVVNVAWWLVRRS